MAAPWPGFPPTSFVRTGDVTVRTGEEDKGTRCCLGSRAAAFPVSVPSSAALRSADTLGKTCRD
jgi:hypothetical protein